MYLKENMITPYVGHDWDGNHLNAKFRFILSVEKSFIIFGAEFPLNVKFLGTKGEFASGLWERSVVEIFIHDADGARYSEFNLSPSGGYWAAEFARYRVSKSEIMISPKIDVEVFTESRVVTMKVERDKNFAGDILISQTAILVVDSGEKNYLVRKFGWSGSARGSLGCDPDFHRRELADKF